MKRSTAGGSGHLLSIFSCLYCRNCIFHVVLTANLQGADIELILILVNKKAWFHTVNTRPSGCIAENYKML